MYINKKHSMFGKMKKLIKIRGTLCGIFLLALFIFCVGFCNHIVASQDNKERAYRFCLNTYCLKACRSYEDLVISSWEWIVEDYVYVCSCHLKEGKKLLNLRIPRKCKGKRH